MKKEQVARRLAKESRISPGAAADAVDRILTDLSERVRKGQNASLPGLGTFRSGNARDFDFDPARNVPALPPKKPKKESK